MSDKEIVELYEMIMQAGFDTVYGKKSDYIERCKPLLGQVQAFVQEFISGNVYGIDEEEYKLMQQDLLDAINDIVNAITNDDRVLMMDALENGICEYLRMFIPDEYMRKRETTVWQKM